MNALRCSTSLTLAICLVATSPGAEHPQLVCTLGEPFLSQSIRQLRFSADGDWLAAGGELRDMYLWDVRNGALARRIELNTKYDLAISSDSWLVAGAGHDGEFRLCELGSGELLASGEGKRELSYVCAAFSPELDCVAFGTRDGRAHLVRTATGELQATLRVVRESQSLGALAFSPDGSKLAVIDGDDVAEGERDMVEIWSIDSGERAATLRCDVRRAIVDKPRRRQQLWSIAWLEDGTIAAIDRDRLCHLWDGATGLSRGQIGRVTTPVVFSSDGRWLVHFPNNELTLVELASGRTCFTTASPERAEEPSRGDGSAYSAATVSCDLRSVAAARSHDRTIEIYSLDPDLKRADRAVADGELLWKQLANDDAARAHASVFALVAGGDAATRMLAAKLSPAKAVEVDGDEIAGRIKELDDDAFRVREAAGAALLAIGAPAVPQLEAAVRSDASAELRLSGRRILRAIAERGSRVSPAELQQLRAIAALEMLGTPAAADELQRLTGGDGSFRQTEHARTALLRLSTRGIQPTRTTP